MYKRGRERKREGEIGRERKIEEDREREREGVRKSEDDI